MNNICLYHASCNDGFAAALVVWQRCGDRYKYFPVQYGEPFPLIEGKIDTLFIVDFSFPKQIMIELEKRCDKLIVIDHHDREGRIEDWVPEKADNFFIWEPSHCGAYLTYQFFNILEGQENNIPNFFLYIEDRDLWKWQLSNSREFSAGLDLQERSFSVWNEIATNEYMLSNVIEEGHTILKFINQKVKSLAEKAIVLKDESGLTYARVNSSLFQSEIGEHLCQNKDVDYADIYFIVEGYPRKIVHSLRSQGRANVTDIAKSKGGGGHPSGRTAGYNEVLE